MGWAGVRLRGLAGGTGSGAGYRGALSSVMWPRVYAALPSSQHQRGQWVLPWLTEAPMGRTEAPRAVTRDFWHRRDLQVPSPGSLPLTVLQALCLVSPGPCMCTRTVLPRRLRPVPEAGPLASWKGPWDPGGRVCWLSGVEHVRATGNMGRCRLFSVLWP